MTKQRKTPQIHVPVYFNPTDFATICQDAASAGKRAVLLQPSKQKEHGFAGQVTYQRKGVGGLLKECWKYWREDKANRLSRAAELAAKKQEIEKEQRKLGAIA